MRTLQDFYWSSEWKKFRASVIASRRTSSGDIICAHCGLPIVRPYDLILHHVIELDETNFTDPEVALNPDNVVCVHSSCHNIIHYKAGSHMRQAWLVWGPPHAGKEKYVRTLVQKGDIWVSLESLYRSLGVGGIQTSLSQLVFPMWDECLQGIGRRSGHWRNAYVVGTYPSDQERERVLRVIRGREVFVDTPIDECLKRCETEQDRMDVERWIRRRGLMS